MSEKEMIGSIFKTARGFWEARILMTAAELDIFSLLLETPKTATLIADELSSDPRGTETLLDALVAIEMLAKKDGAFKIRPGLEKALSSSAPDTILPIILHMAHLWESWGKLTDIVRNGKKEEPAEAARWGEDELKSFINGMHSIGRGMAGEVAARLDLAEKRNVIDIGGGSGVYTIAMLSEVPNMRATIFDRPDVIAIAREKIAEAGLTDRVTFVEGDFYKDDLPGGHDVALLSAVIHQNSPGQNVELYRKALGALEPGGAIVIRDYVMSDDHTETAEGAIFGVNMLVATPEGGVYSFAEMKGDLEQAGFTGAKLVHHAEMDSLVTAQKP